MREWTPIAEEKPRPGLRVLVACGPWVGEAWRTSADTWRRNDGVPLLVCCPEDPDHWMPLPRAPEAGG